MEPPDYQGVAAAAWRGIAGGLRARWGVFLAVASGVLALQVLLPPAVLSAARGRADYFTFNPWLSELPRYLFAADVSWQRKLDFLPGLALFWFSADSPYGGTEWGFTVTASDLARFLLMALLFGGYFALLAHYRHRAGTGSRDPGLGGKGGAVGAFAGALGFTTGGCTVVGCGAPVVPVVGLAFTGLTSGTLSALAQTSRIATAVILIALALAVIYLGWRAGKKGDAHLFPQ